TCSWRTSQLSLLPDTSESSSPTWPKWGSWDAGAAYLQVPAVPPMSATDSGSLPTPTKSWGSRGPGLSNNMDRLRYNKATVETALSIVDAVGWRWPPSFVEWMMGWPAQWSALKPLETDRFRQWCAAHGSA